MLITGLGVRSAVGDDLDTFWRSLATGHSGVIGFEGDPERGLQPYAAAPAAFDPREMASKQLANRVDRMTQLSLLAVGQALRHAGLPSQASVPARSAVCWGTGAGGAGAIEAAYREFYGSPSPRIPPLTVVSGMANAAAGQISIEHALRGPMLAVSNACASAAQAIGEALCMLRAGRADLAIVGGADAFLYPGWVRAWQALGVLAPAAGDAATACRPFDASRSGLVLGEGAAALVLETEQHARARGATALAELAGYGLAADGLHLSRPDGAGQMAAMRMALDDARAAADRLRERARHRHRRRRPGRGRIAAGRLRRCAPWTSSTKALHGHAMGASGAIELIATVLALRERTIVPQWHVRDPIAGAHLPLPEARAAWPDDARAALSNSFAFGGCDVALVVRAA